MIDIESNELRCQECGEVVYKVVRFGESTWLCQDCYDAKTGGGERKIRYEKIADRCKECEAYRPNTGKQCNIYKLLLKEMSPELIKNESFFITIGDECRGFKAKQRS